MKKIISISAMVLVVVLALGLFAACGYSGDPEKDRDTLEKRDYSVLLVTTPVGDRVASITAHRNNVEDFTIAELAKEETLKKLKGDYVKIYYYKDAEAAEKDYDAVKSEFKDIKKVKVSLKKTMIVVTYSLSGKDVMGAQ